MRALVIAPQPFFTPRGTPFSVYYRTLITAQLGVQIDLLTYGQGQDVDIPNVRIVRIPRFALLGPVRVGPSALKLFLDCFMVVWTIGMLLRYRYDFVHAHEEAVFWCRFLKPVFRFTLVYDMHSRLPQQLENFRFTTSKTLIDLFSRLERASLRSAEAVVTICPDLQEHVLAAGLDPGRHVLIENSIFEDVRLEDEAPAMPDGAALTAALAGAGPFVLYAGTFEPYQGLELLLKAFARVAAERRDVRLVMVGGTVDQVEAKRRLAAELGIGNACVFTGQVSQRRAMELTRVADVLVSPRVEGTNTPLKIYEQLASGRPLVATRIRAHTQVLTDEVAILADPEPGALADGLLRALGEDVQQAYAASARSHYEEAYSRPVYEAKVRRLLEILP